MASVKELLERVKAATRADRELNGEIEYLLVNEGKHRIGTHSPDLPNYSGSIDAARALTARLLPGAMMRVFDNPDDGSVRAEIVAVSGQVGRGDHDTWPLAILAAALTSLSTKEG